MADTNRNQDNQFDQSSSGWDQNRRRFDQESDYNRNRENYGSFGNTGSSNEWNRQGNYSGASGSQQGSSRMSDYDENRGSSNWQGRSDMNRGQDTGNMGSYRQSGSDYGRDYRSTGGSGSMGMGSREGYQDWQRSSYGGGMGREDRGYGGEDRGSQYWGRGDEGGYGDMSRRNMASRSYGEVYGGNVEERERMTNQAQGGRQNIREQERMYGGMRDEDWRGSGSYGSDYNRGYGQRSGGYGGAYGDMSRERRMSGMSEYGGRRERRDWEDRDYGRMDRDRDRDRGDRSWWDKTRDEVSSWFGDDDAERRRMMDERRSENYRGRGPKDYKRSDDRIREDVCDRLSDDPYIDASDINVRVEGSEVILSGNVESREAKRRAEDMVESISGVSNVQNQLKVTSRDTSSNRGSNMNPATGPETTREL